MGASNFSQIVVGQFKTTKEAVNEAREDARLENGHRHGYSGDIQTVDHVKVYKGKHPRYNTKAFDKWEDEMMDRMGKREAMMVEITGVALQRIKPEYLKGKRNVKGYYIFGWGAC